MPSLYPILAFVLTVAALYVGRLLALRVGFADAPGGRKQHDDLVPPIGGLAIIPVFVGVSWLAGMDSIVPWPLAAGLGALLLMGAIDDARTIKPFVKFAIMLWTACFVVIFGEMQIGELGNLFGFGPVELGWISKGFTMLCLVLLMNAVNMMDGIDGLAGGFCALVAFWFMIVCLGAGGTHGADILTLSILLATLLGFLVFNMRAPWRKSATVFLGDAGSLCLGLLLGWFCIKISQGSGKLLEPVTVIWVIALPIMDAFALFLARSLRGKHPFAADRRHLHHRLMDIGLSPGQTTVVMLAVVAVMALTGFMAQVYGIPHVVLFGLWMILFIVHTAGLTSSRGLAFFSRNSR